MNSDRQAKISASSARKHALAAGILYLITFVSIPTLSLYGAAHNPSYIAGPGPDTPVLIGTVLEMIVALAGIGTAVTLYPVLKWQNEAVALGFVGTRILEASAIFAGAFSLLTLVTLRQAGVGAEGVIAGRALVAQYDRFFLAQSLMPVMNALLLGSLLHQSRLVPRVLPLLGLIGAVLEMIVALAGIGMAVTLYPVLKWQNEAVALGFVGTRTLEASCIFAGVFSLLTLVTLRQAGVGAEGLVTGRALVAQYDRFFLGQSLMPVMNALLLGSLLYQSRLVPRALPTLGLIGAPLLLAGTLASMFGIIDRMSGLAALITLPIAVWEFSLGVWLTVKGFNPSPIIAESASTETNALLSAAQA